MASWFGMKDAVRMRDTYVKVLESNRSLLNTLRLDGRDTSDVETNIKLYTKLLEDAERRLKAIEEGR